MNPQEIIEQLSTTESIYWYPWIGEKYFETESKHRMLVIGESHYFNPNEDPGKTEANKENLMRRDYSQRVIGEDVQHTTEDYPTYRNFHKALFKHNNLDFTLFWSRVGFFNLIQRPLDSKHNRPSKKEFQMGWQTFEEVLKRLAPSYCIFIGSSAVNHLNKNSTIGASLKRSNVSYFEKINGAYGKQMIVEYENGNTCTCIFMKHSSQYFSPEKWNTFLNQHIKEQMDWLEKQVVRKQFYAFLVL